MALLNLCVNYFFFFNMRWKNPDDKRICLFHFYWVQQRIIEMIKVVCLNKSLESKQNKTKWVWNVLHVYDILYWKQTFQPNMFILIFNIYCRRNCSKWLRTVYKLAKRERTQSLRRTLHIHRLKAFCLYWLINKYINKQFLLIS